MEDTFLTTLVLLFCGALTAGVAINYWNKLVEKTENQLLPWLKQNLMPRIHALIQDAFVKIDEVTVRTRNVAKQAWQNLRKYLLDVTIDFENLATHWIKRTTSYMVRHLQEEPDTPIIIKQTTEEIANYDDLPPEVREAYIRTQSTLRSMNFTKIRDKQMQSIL